MRPRRGRDEGRNVVSPRRPRMLGSALPEMMAERRGEVEIEMCRRNRQTVKPLPMSRAKRCLGRSTQQMTTSAFVCSFSDAQYAHKDLINIYNDLLHRDTTSSRLRNEAIPQRCATGSPVGACRSCVTTKTGHCELPRRYTAVGTGTSHGCNQKSGTFLLSSIPVTQGLRAEKLVAGRRHHPRIPYHQRLRGRSLRSSLGDRPSPWSFEQRCDRRRPDG